MASKKVPTIQKLNHSPTQKFWTILSLSMFRIGALTVQWNPVVFQLLNGLLFRAIRGDAGKPVVDDMIQGQYN